MKQDAKLIHDHNILIWEDARKNIKDKNVLKYMKRTTLFNRIRILELNENGLDQIIHPAKYLSQ